MPYKLVKHTDGTFSVKNSKTGKIHGSHIPYKNALAQMRLLYLIESRSKKQNDPETIHPRASSVDSCVDKRKQKGTSQRSKRPEERIERNAQAL